MRPPSVTIDDVAKAAGVNRSTVSRALSRTGRINEQTSERVRETARRLGYEPNRAARALAGGRAGTIGILVPDLTNPFFSAVTRAAQQRAATEGERVLVADADSRPAAEPELIAELARDADGLILCAPTAPSDDLLDAIGPTPTVLVNRRSSALPAVVADQDAAVAVAVAHLRSLGHRTIGYVRGPASKWTSKVRDAAADRLGAVLLGPFAPTFQGGSEAVDAVLAAGCTAVLTHNDLQAVGLVDALLLLGRRVPDDLSVVGCDDIEIASLVRPRLTSVAMPLVDLGIAATEMLLDLIPSAAEPPGLPATQVLPVRLAERASTGPAPP